ncbi:MAG: tripartite tricarboxylate transporter TctB family protein [Saprospiraceae bacterium]|nr:tripartite tricarboxylate transporter TctB family protein [Saprospiraceae bacterium]
MSLTISKNKLGGLLCLLLGIAVFLGSRQFPPLDDGYPGPGLFPSIVGVCLTIAGLVLFLQHLPKSTNEGNPQERPRPLALASVALILLGAYFGIAHLGLLPIVAVVILGTGLLIGGDIKWIIAASLITTALVYVLFSLILGVPL